MSRARVKEAIGRLQHLPAKPEGYSPATAAKDLVANLIMTPFADKPAVNASVTALLRPTINTAKREEDGLPHGRLEGFTGRLKQLRTHLETSDPALTDEVKESMRRVAADSLGIALRTERSATQVIDGTSELIRDNFLINGDLIGKLADNMVVSSSTERIEEIASVLLDPSLRRVLRGGGIKDWKLTPNTDGKTLRALAAEVKPEANELREQIYTQLQETFKPTFENAEGVDATAEDIARIEKYLNIKPQATDAYTRSYDTHADINHVQTILASLAYAMERPEEQREETRLLSFLVKANSDIAAGVKPSEQPAPEQPEAPSAN